MSCNFKCGVLVSKYLIWHVTHLKFTLSFKFGLVLKTKYRLRNRIFLFQKATTSVNFSKWQFWDYPIRFISKTISGETQEKLALSKIEAYFM